jgi:hypothetical protein
MESAIVTGAFTIAAVIVTWVLATAQRRADARGTERAKAEALFIQISTAIGVMETERALFRHRRDSWKANFLAGGQALLHVIAAHVSSGNWVSGAATGIDALAAWDANEGARFTDRYTAASIQASAALVQLSLMSDRLQQAAGEVTDTLFAYQQARKSRQAQLAEKQLMEAIRALRTAVRGYRARRRRFRRGRKGR